MRVANRGFVVIAGIMRRCHICKATDTRATLSLGYSNLLPVLQEKDF